MRSTFTAFALFAAAMLAIAGSANAKTGRDHRGDGPPPPPTHLSCGSFKYCVKSGVVVRDHRDGATPGGK